MANVIKIRIIYKIYYKVLVERSSSFGQKS